MADRKKQFSGMDEAEVARLAKTDNAALEYVLDGYKNLVRKKAHSYYLIGGDQEDLVQEGMIGLYKAVRDFDGTRQPSFSAFAELCVRRQMMTAIKTANRQKHRPLNSYVPMDPDPAGGGDRDAIGGIPAPGKDSDPAEIVIAREESEDLQDRLASVLSRYERDVLALYVSGMSYRQMAEELGKNEKSVDNAVSRIKNKLEKLMEPEEDRQS